MAQMRPVSYISTLVDDKWSMSMTGSMPHSPPFLLLLAVVTILAPSVSGRRADGQAPNPERAQTAPELVVQTGHTSFVQALAFSPDDKLIASGSVDSVVEIWDSVTGRELRALPGPDGIVNA